MDLHAPLGRTSPPPRRRVLPAIGIALLISGLGALGAYLILADPHGGQPYAVATIPPAPSSEPAPSKTQPDPMPTASIGASATAAADVTRVENGVKVVSPSGDAGSMPRATGPIIIDVSKALDEGARRASPAARSKAPDVKPAKSVLSGAAASGLVRPRIAIFVGGLGLSEGATRTATEIMPAAIALAFVPADEKVAASVAFAKSKGHEVLLQLPMQNAQGTSLMPHTLSAGGAPGQTANDLSWLMSRFDGYVGVTNLLGAPVTADSTAMKTILAAVRQRGLFYVDDGTSKRSLASTVARPMNLPQVRADVVLDATNNPTAVRANLDRLVAIARKNGTAIGVASGLSDHLATIARFAGDLDSQGLTLVPVSSLARSSASLATTR